MPQHSKADTDLRTPEDAAKILGVSTSTIRRLGKLGQLDTIVIGKRTHRITQASLDRYVETAKRKHAK